MGAPGRYAGVMRLLAAVGVSLASVLLPAQVNERASRSLTDAVPLDLSRIEGRITDVEGRPLPAEAVDARFELQPAEGLSRGTVLEILRRVPLPPLRVGPDGRVAMAVTELHRAVLVPELGDWSYVVSAAGYHSWRQRLPQGIAGLLGLDAELAPERPAQRVRVDVPARGRERLVWVRHWLRSLPGGGPALWESRDFVLGVGHDSFEIAVPEAPSPFDLGDKPFAEWGTSATVLDPFSGRMQMAHLREGRAAEMQERLPNPRKYPWRFVAEAGAEQTLPGVRVLVGGPLSRVWIALGDDGRLRLPKSFRILAAWAPGHRIRFDIEDDEEIVLPAVDIERRLRIVVARPRGARIPDADVVVESLEPRLSDAALRVPLPRPLFRGRTDASGRLELPVELLREPLVVHARAPGYHQELVIDPRVAPDELARTIIRLGPVAPRDDVVRLVAVDGAPIARGLVVGRSGSREDPLASPVVVSTDREGFAVLPGSIQPTDLLALAEGYLPSRVKSPQRVDRAWQIDLLAARRRVIRTLDEDDAVVPGASLRILAERVVGGLSDRRGNLLVTYSGRVPVRFTEQGLVAGLSTVIAPDDLEGLQHVRVQRTSAVRTEGDGFDRLCQAAVPDARHFDAFALPMGFVRSGVVLANWQHGEGREQYLALEAGAPLRITQGAVDAAAEGAGGVRRIDGARRRVFLDFAVGAGFEEGGFDPGLAQVEFVAARGRGDVGTSLNRQRVTFDDAGRAMILLDAPEPVDLVLLHPDCLPVPFRAPGVAVGAEEARVELPLRHAARVTAVFPVRGATPGPLLVDVVWTPSTPHAPTRLRELVDLSADELRAGCKSLLLPHGNRPGTARLVVHPTGGDAQLREFVLGEEDVVLDLGPGR